MLAAIHKDVFGASQHLCLDGETFWRLDTIPPNVWTVGDNNSKMQIEWLSRLLNDPIPDVGTLSQRSSMSSICPNRDAPIPWHYVLSKSEYRNQLQKLVKSVESLVSPVPRYASTLVRNMDFIRSLSRLKVDQELLSAHLRRADLNISSQSSLRTFNPSCEGFADPIVYDILSTSTGRMTIATGPQVLIQPSDTRDIIVSRYPGGKVYSVDFVSLEPRVLKSLAGGPPAPTDIYSHVQSIVGVKSLTREQVKKTIISILYGASSKKIGELSTTGNASSIVAFVKEYFGVNEIFSKLEFSFNEKNLIENFYGRPLRVDAESRHVWLNHFVQSTAVDVALGGFANCSKNLREISDLILPIALIHDAILYDVPAEYDQDFVRSLSEGILTDLGVFPITISENSRGVKCE